MEEEEALKNSGHVTETVGWLAIESGTGDWGDLQYQAGHTGNSVNHKGYNLNFDADFENLLKKAWVGSPQKLRLMTEKLSQRGRPG